MKTRNKSTNYEILGKGLATFIDEINDGFYLRIVNR